MATKRKEKKAFLIKKDTIPRMISLLIPNMYAIAYLSYYLKETYVGFYE
jgi:hypothetical protein